MLFELLRILIFAALPVMAVSYLMVNRALSSKRLHDFSDNESFKSAMKEMKSAHKSRKKKRAIFDNPANYALDKWLYFGGGYYGLMVFATFLYIEFWQIIGFLGKLWNLSLSQLFSSITINLLVDLLVDAILNLVDAFIWFMYWQKHIDMQNGWLWLIATYLAYLLGARLARQFPLKGKSVPDITNE